jgi:hypothetical protein
MRSDLLAAVDNNSASFTVVVQGNADRTTVVTIVLTDNLLGLKLPEASVMVAAGRNQVRRVGAERTVPNPALVAGKRTLQLEWHWLGRLATRGRDHFVEILNLPNFRGVVSGAGSKVLDIWREQDSGDVLAMSLEVGDGDKSCLLAVLLKMPDKNVALELVRPIEPNRGACQPFLPNCFPRKGLSHRWQQ